MLFEFAGRVDLDLKTDALVVCSIHDIVEELPAGWEVAFHIGDDDELRVLNVQAMLAFHCVTVQEGTHGDRVMVLQHFCQGVDFLLLEEVRSLAVCDSHDSDYSREG